MDYSACGETQTLRWSALKGMRKGASEVTLPLREEDPRAGELLSFMGSPAGNIERILESKIGPELESLEKKIDVHTLKFQQYIGRTVQNKVIEKMCVRVVGRTASNLKNTIMGLFYEE